LCCCLRLSYSSSAALVWNELVVPECAFNHLTTRSDESHFFLRVLQIKVAPHSFDSVSIRQCLDSLWSLMSDVFTLPTIAVRPPKRSFSYNMLDLHYPFGNNASMGVAYLSVRHLHSKPLILFHLRS